MSEGTFSVIIHAVGWHAHFELRESALDEVVKAIVRIHQDDDDAEFAAAMEARGESPPMSTRPEL